MSILIITKGHNSVNTVQGVTVLCTSSDQGSHLNFKSRSPELLLFQK